jgi:hypothetical protein
MRRFDVEQDGVLAGAAPVREAGAGLDACEALALAGALTLALTGALAAATLDWAALGGEVAAWVAAWLLEPEPFEPHPTARIAEMAIIPPVSEFWTTRTLRAI